MDRTAPPPRAFNPAPSPDPPSSPASFLWEGHLPPREAQWACAGPRTCALSRWFPSLPFAPSGTGSPAHSAAPAQLAGTRRALAWRRGARRDAGGARPRARGVGLDVRSQDGGSGRFLLEAPIPGRSLRRGPPAGEPRRWAGDEGWREGRGDRLHVRGRRRRLRGPRPGEERDPLPPPGV